jgi:hypothetical protein
MHLRLEQPQKLEKAKNLIEHYGYFVVFEFHLENKQ